jgi:hypothetical protein
MTLSARRLAVYALETKYEFLKQFRLPVAILFNFGFPVMFYTVFGLIFGRQTSSVPRCSASASAWRWSVARGGCY